MMKSTSKRGPVRIGGAVAPAKLAKFRKVQARHAANLSAGLFGYRGK